MKPLRGNVALSLSGMFFFALQFSAVHLGSLEHFEPNLVEFGWMKVCLEKLPESGCTKGLPNIS